MEGNYFKPFKNGFSSCYRLQKMVSVVMGEKDYRTNTE